MKRAVLRQIGAWQASPNRPRGRCKFTPSCSTYAYEVIDNRGLAVGGILTAWRIMRCNPLSVGGVDPPPQRRYGHG